MTKELFGDILFVLFYSAAFVCWGFIAVYGYIRLTESKKRKL